MSVATQRVTTENAPFSDHSKNFQTFLKTFEIASETNIHYIFIFEKIKNHQKTGKNQRFYKKQRKNKKNRKITVSQFTLEKFINEKQPSLFCNDTVKKSKKIASSDLILKKTLIK